MVHKVLWCGAPGAVVCSVVHQVCCSVDYFVYQGVCSYVGFEVL